MKKLKKWIIKELPPVKLYLDDLDSIYEILRQKVKNIDIKTEDYVVEDVKQLKNLGTEKLHHLSIECSDPNIDIQFYPGWVKIQFYEDSTYNRGILSEIEDIINKRRVLLGSFLTSNWAFFLNGGLFSGSLIGLWEMPQTYMWLFLALLLISILSLIFLWKFRITSYSTIMLLERKEETSFWKRNKDEVFIAIISAIAGSLVTIFIMWISNLL